MIILVNSVCNEGYFCKFIVFLVDVVVYVELLLVIFINLVCENNLELLLVEIVKKYDWIFGCVVVIKLIGYLDKIIINIVNVL